jgi:hypothetical protein
MDDPKAEYYLLGKGTWLDFLPTVPRPVFAFGTKQLYRVMIHGSGINLPIGSDSKASGFYTTRFVAASSKADAGQIAMSRVEVEWTNRGYRDLGGNVTLETDQVDPLIDRFMLRSAMGFTFYTESDADENPCDSPRA